MLSYLIAQHHSLSLTAQQTPASLAVLFDEPAASSVLLFLGAIACAALVSTAARLFRQIVNRLKDLIRLFVLTTLAAALVFAVMVLAFVDLMHR